LTVSWNKYMFHEDVIYSLCSYDFHHGVRTFDSYKGMVSKYLKWLYEVPKEIEKEPKITPIINHLICTYYHKIEIWLFEARMNIIGLK
jgi:hypothetical protein